MQRFHKIDDAQCIVRLRGGVHKQLDMYARGDRVYIPFGGGYIRVVAAYGGVWGTASPNVSVLEWESDDIASDGKTEPKYIGESHPKKAA